MSEALSLDYLSKIGLRVEGRSADGNAIGKANKVEKEQSPIAVAKGPLRTLRVLSFNVLFPNSETSGVWWIYKYFDVADAETPTGTGCVDATDWQHRALLLRQLVERVDADIVCFQEPWNSRGASKFADLSPEEAVQATFKSDFAFMVEIGYEGELLEKGNIRPATFWKIRSVASAQGEVEAPCPNRSSTQKPLVLKKVSSVHKVNRALLTLFEVTMSEDSSNVQHVVVINCHLTAAPVPKERLATVEDGLKAAGKLCNEVMPANAGNAPKGKKGKAAAATPSVTPNVSVILCGDFNSSSSGVVDTFLTTGEVGPDDTIGLKKKAHAFPHFIDCGKGSGPSMVVPNIDTKMVRPFEEREQFPADLVAKVKQLEEKLKSTTGRCIESGAVQKKDFTIEREVMCVVNEQVLMPQMLERLRQCFNKIKETPSGLPQGKCLSDNEISGRQVNWWLQQINRQVGRGTEFRHAREIQCSKLPAGHTDVSEGNSDLLPSLTFEEFATVMRLECEEGKFWAVEHDLRKLCGNGMRKHGDLSYEGRFDYIYVSSNSSGALQLVSADTVAFFPQAIGGVDGKLKSLAQLGLASGGINSFVLPNTWHPSDHLPIVADFTV